MRPAPMHRLRVSVNVLLSKELRVLMGDFSHLMRPNSKVALHRYLLIYLLPPGHVMNVDLSVSGAMRNVWKTNLTGKRTHASIIVHAYGSCKILIPKSK